MRITNWNRLMSAWALAALFLAAGVVCAALGLVVDAALPPSGVKAVLGFAAFFGLMGVGLSAFAWFTPMWVELTRGGLMVRRAGGADHVEWRELGPITLERKTTAVRIAIFDIPLYDTLSLRFARARGGSFKVKVNRGELTQACQLVKAFGQARLLPT